MPRMVSFPLLLMKNSFSLIHVPQYHTVHPKTKKTDLGKQFFSFCIYYFLCSAWHYLFKLAVTYWGEITGKSNSVCNVNSLITRDNLVHWEMLLPMYCSSLIQQRQVSSTLRILLSRTGTLPNIHCIDHSAYTRRDLPMIRQKYASTRTASFRYSL